MYTNAYNDTILLTKRQKRLCNILQLSRSYIDGYADGQFTRLFPKTRVSMTRQQYVLPLIYGYVKRANSKRIQYNHLIILLLL